MSECVLWDNDNDEPASNWDGTTPTVIEGVVYIKELGCNCNPASGSVCGSCADVTESYEIGGRFTWKGGDA